MASSNFKSTKQRSHSSPELQFTNTSTCGEASGDENVKKILNELVEFKDKVETSAQSLSPTEQRHKVLTAKHGKERPCCSNDGTNETGLHSTVSGSGAASETRDHVFFKGFKFLLDLLGKKYLKDSGKGGSVSKDVEGDMQASFGPRQQRSKSVCGILLSKLKYTGQRQSNQTSSSDDSYHDVSRSHAHNLDKVIKRKHKRHKMKSTSPVSADVSQAKFLKHADLENNCCDNNSLQHSENCKRSVENAPSFRAASSAAENESEIVSVPSCYKVPVASANDQTQSVPRHQASSTPASQPFPHVVTTTQNIYAHYDALSENGTFSHRTVHTQIDYMHCLIPDQWGIINSPYYWGQLNRFEADNLLANKEEGTFILRDSTQEEFVFSVSFRRYGRTLHARIEQWNHKFTFDAHDPGVHSSQTICGLLEHYKNPNFCMFFEPMLTAPLLKKNPQSLQELCRARICTHISYNGISSLKLPIVLREYLRIYHYKQRVRVRKMEVDRHSVADNQPGVITNTCLSSVHSIIL